MSPRTRKRRRSQAFPDDVVAHLVDTSEQAQDAEALATAKLEKENEIWEAFREEHYEAIEQLPLTLHRQFILMRELDEQANGCNADLLPTVHKYISLRRSITSRKQSGTEGQDECAEVDATLRQSRSSNTTAGPSTPSVTLAPINCTPASSMLPVSPTKLPSTPQIFKWTPVASGSLATPRTPTPMSIPPERLKPPLTTREMLSHMAWLSEEVLRASEEKVNLAQAAYDSVDRHIRLVDQAIKEQETSISMGIRPGTHPAPIVLPDIVVPRWARPPRVTLSPDVDAVEGGKDADGGPTLGIVTNDDLEGPKVQPKGRKGKKLGRGKWPKKKEELAPEDVPDTRRSGRTLRITGPAVPEFAVPPHGLVVGASEAKFCYCNQVSFGTMIACDGRKCKREWFHLQCAGLPEVPKGKWYCRDCRRK